MASRLAPRSPTPAPEVPSETAPASPNDMLQAQRDAPLGGQAVLEGVMMRGVRNWAVAVRKPADPPGDDAGSRSADRTGDDSGLGRIDVRSFPLTSWSRRRRVYRLPVIRGVVALLESLGI